MAPLAPATMTLAGSLLTGRCRDLLRVAGVQDHGQHPGPGLGARGARHPMQGPARLVERLPGFQRLRGLLAESELELPLQHIPEDRTCVPVRPTGLSWF